MTGNRWVKRDRRYRSGYRWTPYAYLAFWKWTFLIAAWIGLNIIVTAVHAGWLVFVTTGGLIWYAVHRIRLYYRKPQLPAATWEPLPPARPMRFNRPPGWPPPPAGWTPEPGWQPNPTWPPLPDGWQLWIPDEAAPVGERNSRTIPQDVKIAVAARDNGRCRQCGSSQDLHFDHVIPWSKGGANTVSNIQLLCGPCNRSKGADDIPAGL
jgi:HNH endonuclease